MTGVSTERAPDARKLLLAFAVAGFSVLALSGCNTVEGAGKDVEAAGEAIQEGADND